PITLWRCVDDMADVDCFAAPEVDHLPSAEPRGADGAHFLPMAHDDLVSRSNLGCCVDRTDSEDVALREEVLDLDPVSVRVGEDRTARECKGLQSSSRVHCDLPVVWDLGFLSECMQEHRYNVTRMYVTLAT